MGMDVPNSDLKTGDFIIIDEWVGQMAFVKTAIDNGVVVQSMEANESGDATKPNRLYIGDVIEVLAIQHPHMTVDVHTVRGQGDYSRIRTYLRATEFNCRVASSEYVAAVLSGRPTPPPVAVEQPVLAELVSVPDPSLWRRVRRWFGGGE